MVCDLEHTFLPLSYMLPAETSGQTDFVFYPAALPLPRTSLATDRLVISKGSHQYNSYYRTDLLRWQAHKPTYRYLGLLILSVVFHEAVDQVQVDILHPDSDIKHLIVEYPYPREPRPGYTTRPYTFDYYPRATEKHPWCYATPAPLPRELPCFYLTNLDDTVYTDDEWAKRDTVRGFGSDVGSVRLAELLLNASLPHNDVVEYQLEGEGGFRGVGEHSADAELFLPGGLGWLDCL